MTTAPPRTPRPTRQQLAAQVRAVLADLPWFLTAPLFRRWHLRWGATPGEVEAALPGDELQQSVRRAWGAPDTTTGTLLRCRPRPNLAMLETGIRTYGCCEGT
jgi:hypothetical protein